MPQLPTVLLGKEWNSYLLNSYYEPGTSLCDFTYLISLTPMTPPAAYQLLFLFSPGQK